ncbi:MAG: HD domain-containing protein [Ignavibacteriales bacterium]|nr:HD domain-containing protein [Ignavibacteriales bacterium]
MKNIEKEISKFEYFKIASQTADELNVELFIVGGYVRDLILRRKKNEVDFLVVKDGAKFASSFAKRLGVSQVTIFKNFGTAHFKSHEIDFEFVGARKESYKRDSRNPIIEEGTFIDDISRRDFTINTLAISLNKKDFGKLVDTFNGLNDIKNKIIKTPIDPLKTFNDDPLRILRAFRFASQLQFEVEDSIMLAAKQLADRLKIISQERITDEFMKILASPRPSVGLLLLNESGVLKIIFPEIANLTGIEQRKDFHHKDVFYHTLQVVDNIAKVSEKLWLRFAGLVHDIAKPQTKKFDEKVGWTFHTHDYLGAKMLKKIFYRMKLPLTELPYVEKLVKLHLRPIALVDDGVTDSAVRRLSANAGADLEDLIILCRADITSKNIDKVQAYMRNYDNVMKKVVEVQEKDKLREFQSPVRGDEIMKVCNIPPSRLVGEIKTAIEEAILDGKIGNIYEEAYQYLLQIKDEFIK